MSALRNLFAALLVSITAQLAAIPATAQDAQSAASQLAFERAQLENDKLKAEIRALAKPEPPKSTAAGQLVTLLSGLAAFVGGAASFAVGQWTSHMQRRGATDQKIHDERTRQYKELLGLTRPFALYFPADAVPANPEPGKPALEPAALEILSPALCARYGRLLSDWYFVGGGLVMSARTRDAYFALSGALTGAASVSTLNAPRHPGDARQVTKNKIDARRKSLLVAISGERVADLAGEGKKPVQLPDGPHKFWTGEQVSETLANPALIDNWTFGSSRDASGKPRTGADTEFSDFLIIQNASSRLRTAMAEDLHSRRRPE